MLLATVSLNRKVSCATMPMSARSDARLRSRTSWPSTSMAPAGDVVEARHQVGQGGLAGAARAHQRHHLAGLHFQVEVLNLEAVGRAGIAERHVLEDDAALEARPACGAPGFSTISST